MEEVLYHVKQICATCVRHVWTNGNGGEVSLVVKWLGLGHSILIYTPTQKKNMDPKQRMAKTDDLFVSPSVGCSQCFTFFFFPAVWKVYSSVALWGGHCHVSFRVKSSCGDYSIER